MIYTQQFKEKAFRVLRFTPFIIYLMKALDKEDDMLLRYVLEDALDDKELFDRNLVSDEGDRIILNSKTNSYKERIELYSEFMEYYTTKLDVPVTV